MRHARHLLLLVLLVAAGALSAVAVAACGGDDDEQKTAQADEEVQLRVTDDSIDPERVEVTPGTIRFTIDNDGQAQHEIAIETPNGVERSGGIEPEDSKSLTVELDEGEYAMYATDENARAEGIEGVIVVEPDVDTVTQEQTVTDEETETETQTVTDEETNTVTQERTVTQQQTVTQTQPRTSTGG